MTIILIIKALARLVVSKSLKKVGSRTQQSWKTSSRKHRLSTPRRILKTKTLKKWIAVVAALKSSSNNRPIASQTVAKIITRHLNRSSNRLVVARIKTMLLPPNSLPCRHSEALSSMAVPVVVGAILHSLRRERTQIHHPRLPSLTLLEICTAPSPALHPSPSSRIWARVRLNSISF